MTHNPYNSAANAYRQAGNKGLSPVEIVVALYQGILNHLREAKTAYKNRDLGKMCEHNDKIFTILIALQSHLDHEKGKSAAEALDRFYTAVFLNVAKILEKTDPYKSYEDIEAHIADVCGQWMTLSRKIAKAGEGTSDTVLTSI